MLLSAGLYDDAVQGERRGPRGPHVDLADPAIPRAIAALRPTEIEVGANEVGIVLGEFPTGQADGEYDYYGLVCTSTGAGNLSRKYRSERRPEHS